MRVFLFVAFCIAAASAQDGIYEVCGARADIFFVLDSSGSVGPKNFQTTKNFVIDVINTFTIGRDDVQIGVIQYSDKASLRIPLENMSNKSMLLQWINETLFLGGGTKTGDALGVMLQQFSNSTANRPDAVDIGIVITDGQSNDVLPNAQYAKNRGIKMFAVGIGSQVVENELLEIASGPSYYFNISDYNSLESIRGELTNKTCLVATYPPTTMMLNTTMERTSMMMNITEPTTTTPEPTTPPPTTATEAPTTTPQCYAEAADIVFAMDSSGSIGVQNYEVLKKFVEDLVQSLNIGKDAVRVGLIRFSDSVASALNLNSFYDKQSIIQAIRTIPYDSMGTQTNKALDYLEQYSFSANNGARSPVVPKIAIVITDGQSSYPAATVVAADRLHKKNVAVFAIGITGNVDQTELEAIATGTGSKNVLTVDTFAALDNIKAAVANLTCEELQATRPTFTPAPPTAKPPCSDVEPNCDLYGRGVCTDYEPWSRKNCECYCGFCPCPKEKGPPCIDNIANCADYAGDLCTRPSYRIWVKSNCRKFCKLCDDNGIVAPTTPRVCVDKLPNCKDYGTATCKDPIFQTWVKENCEKHCNLC